MGIVVQFPSMPTCGCGAPAAVIYGGTDWVCDSCYVELVRLERSSRGIERAPTLLQEAEKPCLADVLARLTRTPS